jgi:3-oxoadipate enol-lactonase
MPFSRINGVLLHYRLSGPVGAPVLAFANSLGTDARIMGLLNELGLGRIGLAGVSVGGLIAQGFALRHPDRLAGLVLCATAPRMGDAKSWTARIASIRDGGMASIADGIMERWFSERFRREAPDELAGWRNMFLRTHVEGYCSTCATLRDSDLGDAVGGIRVPTLVVAGDQDGSMSIDMVRVCADAIPGARFEVLAGSGHIPSIERPGELATMIGDFMRRVGHG